MPTVALIGPELYPIPPIRGGAAELFIEKAAGRLTGWRPVVIGVSDPQLPRRETRDGVEYFRVDLTGWRRRLYCRYRHVLPLYDRQVARIIHHIRPDLVHVHNRPLLALYLRRRLGGAVPVILHRHNRERSRLGRGAGRHGVIYNGVEPGDFASLWDPASQRRQVREQYGLTDEPVVLFAGKLRESKGVHILVRAMARVWEAAPRAVLVLVGGTEYGRGRTARETPFMGQLRRDLAGAAGRVVLTGFLPPADMPRAYLLGDVFAGPSQIEEGLGLVFLEAAAAGLPVIATRRGGIPEVVQDGVTGLLLRQPDDDAELAAHILGLLGDAPRRQRLGQQGREMVHRNFTWEKIARDLEEFYDDIRDQGPGIRG
jgi:spore coat protein SA